MLAKETLDLIRELRAGRMQPHQVSELEQQLASEFITDLKSKYPITFQERQIGNKREVGLARSMSLEPVIRQIPKSYFTIFFLMPVLRHCMFVSSYNNRITEVTTVANIQVVPNGGDSLEVSLKIGRSHKLDRTPDGWRIKKLKQRLITLSEAFLSARGWNFKVFDLRNIEWTSYIR